MKALTLRYHEINRLKRDGQVLVLRVCKEAMMLPGFEQRARLKLATAGASEWAAAVYPARDAGWIAWAPKDGPDLAAFTKKHYARGFLSPGGAVGAKRWVREAWCGELDSDGDIRGVCAYHADTSDVHAYAFADSSIESWHRAGHTGWLTPTRMTPQFSRFVVQTEDVRVQRVQAIEEPDQIAAGVIYDPDPIVGVPWWIPCGGDTPSQAGFETSSAAFRRLWDTLYAKRWRTFDDNPWVWLMTVKMAEIRK